MKNICIYDTSENGIGLSAENGIIELPQWDRPAMIGVQVREKADGIFTGASLIWDDNSSL